MRKTWLTDNSICLAMGDAVALNLMFESKYDHELFLNFWKKYMSKMATLLNYHLSPTGWTLLFKTKGKKEIEEAYHSLRLQSKKAKKEHTLKDHSRMISEHFRILLSQYVRRSNAQHGRKGTKVLQRFKKYIVNESSDYEQLFKKITRLDRKNPQRTKKYQADESKYDIQKEMTHDSPWKVGNQLYMGLETGFRLRFGVEIIRPNSSVLRNFMYKQNNLTNPPTPP